jgi:membrane associated rhomboid family serine protease
MLIPWGTDAPLYHRPVATITLIVLNILSLLMFPADTYKDWTLVLGDGAHPVQWLTNNFMHSGWFHLAGNMIFLWTFGFVVEGKLGWWVFTLVYLGLGVSESAAMQLLVPSPHEVRMLGSSTIIFGLLAMCLVWAPRNEVLCLLWLGFRPLLFDLSILWFAVLYLVWELLTAGMSGVILANVTDYSSLLIVALALDHTFGAILGFVVGVVLLKRKWVDCENWDLFAVLQGRVGQSKKRADRLRRARPRVSVEFAPRSPTRSKRRKNRDRAQKVRSIEDASAAALRVMRQHLELGEVEAALAIYNKSIRSLTGWQPPEPDWRTLIEALLDQAFWNDAVLVMRDYVLKLPDPSPRVRLKLAQILIQRLSRPLQALKVLGQIPEGSLPESLAAIRRQLARKAEAMQEEGPLELEDELW